MRSDSVTLLAALFVAATVIAFWRVILAVIATSVLAVFLIGVVEVVIQLRCL